MPYDPNNIEWLTQQYIKSKGVAPPSKEELLAWWDIEEPVSAIMATNPGEDEEAVRQYVIQQHQRMAAGPSSAESRRRVDEGSYPMVPSHKQASSQPSQPSNLARAHGGSPQTYPMEGGQAVARFNPMGNAAALDILRNSAFNRPTNRGGGDSMGRMGAASSGGPEDMVQAAIMEHLRYMLQPDVSAAPMGSNDLAAMGATSEYPDLKYDTALSNPRAAESIGPLMEMYANVGAQRRANQMGDIALQRAQTENDILQRRGTMKQGKSLALPLQSQYRDLGARLTQARARAEAALKAGQGIFINEKDAQTPVTPDILAKYDALLQGVAKAAADIDMVAQMESAGYPEEAAAALSRIQAEFNQLYGKGVEPPPPATTGGGDTGGEIRVNPKNGKRYRKVPGGWQLAE